MPAAVEVLFLQPLLEHFGDLLIVPLRKREVRIPVNADIGQTDYFGIAAVTVNCCGKEIGYFRSRAPVVIVWMPGRSFRNVVAVEDQDGNAREFQESFHRHFFGFHVPEKAGVLDWSRDFAFGKQETAAGLIGDNTFDVIALHTDKPADTAALRVRHENGISRFLKDRSQSVCIDLGVIGRRVGRHLPEELIQRFGILLKDRSGVKFRPQSHAKLPEKEASVGSSGDLSGYRASSGIAATWLIHQIDRVAVGKKDVFEAVSSVWRSAPSFGGLTGTVQKDERQRSRLCRNLVAYDCMIAVKRLCLSLRMIRILSFFGCNYGAADGETALINDRDGRHG